MGLRPSPSNHRGRRVFALTPMNNLLIAEQPLILLPKLAKTIGLNEAIVAQQVYFLLGMKAGGRVIDGHKWIWNTLDEWQAEHFPFFSVMTLRRTIASLEKMEVLISCQPDGRMSRKKYYRIDVTKLGAAARRVQNEQMEGVKKNTSKTETTAETTKSKEPKGTAFATQDAAEVVSPDIPANWKPSSKREMTKEQLLAKLPVPKDYPSEDEFNTYLEDEDCDNVLSNRDLYRDLCLRKWHHWRQDLHRWNLIKDWRKYVVALEDTMATARSF